MSQKELTKYTARQHPNNKNPSLTMRYETKPNALAAVGPNGGSGGDDDGDANERLALYENCHLLYNNNNLNNNNNGSRNNDSKTTHYSAATSKQNKSVAFNSRRQFVHYGASDSADDVYEAHANANGNGNGNASANSIADTPGKSLDRIDPLPDYENFSFRHHLQLDKRVLLQKYFRTALVGPRDCIYENLCRGCNYGVFGARGPLCSFCECIVNGVSSLGTSPDASSSNIYENICAHCAQFYSGNEDDCQCRKQLSFKEELPIQIGSEECLLQTAKQRVKLQKSKSFNKTPRPRILSNIWDTLRRQKTPPAPRKPLEIVHHVEGYDQVFHTKETFDLQRICELKRTATSCSDQHIYGRLKQRDLQVSQEDFLSTQSLLQPEQKVKKSRVSKVKFLRSLSAHEACSELKSEQELRNAQNPQYYLNASVCQWMTSLRREAHSSASLNTCILAVSDEEEIQGGDLLQCHPKSIPARNLLIAKGKAPNGTVTKRRNIYREAAEITGETSADSCEAAKPFGPCVSDHYQQMVEEFKFHLQNKQMKQQQPQTSTQQKQQQQQNALCRLEQENYAMMNETNNLAGVNGAPEIPLRPSASANHNRAKRQGMYLRLGEEQVNYERAESKPREHGSQREQISPETVTGSREQPLLLANSAVNDNRNELATTTVSQPSHLVVDKRLAIHELRMLPALEELLAAEGASGRQYQESLLSKANTDGRQLQLQPYVMPPLKSLIKIDDLKERLALSGSLNRMVICYDHLLAGFLRAVFSARHGEKYKHKTHGQLLSKYRRFCSYLGEQREAALGERSLAASGNSLHAKLDLMQAKAVTGAQENRAIDNRTRESHDNRRKGLVLSEQTKSNKPKSPPQVPRRDPTTRLSPTQEQLPSNMTVPAGNSDKPESSLREAENIYQPIWKFKTVGEAQEHFKTDEDYYDIKRLQKGQLASAASIPDILISEEDHSEWEPDEEFVFSSSCQREDSHAAASDANGTMRSNRSNDSSLGTSSSLSGSTITDFASSTATLASSLSSSLMHQLFRNIGIFYSLSEPKLRAIVYDYDRIHASRYFAQKPSSSGKPDDDSINDSGLGISPTPRRLAASAVGSESPRPLPAKAATAPNPPCVEAWKLQLLNVNYMEDEEDMIVSESEILKANTIKEEIEPQQIIPPPAPIQRFKSRSTDNILDLPLEDDKRSFGDRVRDKFQRGILNINSKSSPKSEKRLYKAIRNAQTTSLYLEEGLNPKYPIFKAPLNRLELNQTTCPNVPRFVADCIEYIERKDRIVQDGLYRACGNKFSIDELKQKLSSCYIYDPKLIVADDIHTITSLLKQFFRDLPQPLIPQETYNHLARDLTLKKDVEVMRIAINEMPEPNKSTLAFLIKHLTNVAACSASNRMNASNLAIVWGPSLFTLNEAHTYDIGRVNTLAKVLIENYDRIFHTNERLL